MGEGAVLVTAVGAFLGGMEGVGVVELLRFQLGSGEGGWSGKG
jgi:hypothetical protein